MSGSKLNNIFSAASQYTDEGLIKIRDDRILIKVMDESQSAQYACLIPDTAMYEFERNGINEIAVNYDNISDFIPSNDVDVELKYGQYKNVNKIAIRHGGSEVRVSTITKEEVADVQADIPDLTPPIKIVSDPDFLFDFISKCKKIGSDSFMISPREGTFYLYGERNDDEIIDRIPYEDFNNYEVNWENGNVPTDSINNPNDPAETHEIDVMLSCDLAEKFTFWTDKAIFSIDNHMPFKAMFEDEDGIKVSWMLAPRIPKDGSPMQLPENVIQQRGLEEMT